jgi:hypothetical protein
MKEEKVENRRHDKRSRKTTIMKRNEGFFIMSRVPKG